MINTNTLNSVVINIKGLTNCFILNEMCNRMKCVTGLVKKHLLYVTSQTHISGGSIILTGLIPNNLFSKFLKIAYQGRGTSIPWVDLTLHI